MYGRIRKYAPLLRKLHRLSTKDKKKLLNETLDREFINCICECCKNVIKGNIPLTTNQKKALLRHKKTFRKLVLKKTPTKQKRRLIQTGGFLGALLTPLISILGNLFGGNRA